MVLFQPATDQFHDFRLTFKVQSFENNKNRDSFVEERIVFHDDVSFLVNYDICPRFPFGSCTRHLANGSFLDEYSVPGQLFMDQDDFLTSIDDEVATGIVRTFLLFDHFIERLVVKRAPVTSQHDRHPTDGDILPTHSLVPSHVLNVDRDLSRVGDVPKATLLW